MNISLAAEQLFNLGPLKVTNSLLATWIVMIILIALSLIGRNFKTIPSRFQSLVEMVIESLLNLVEGIAGSNARRIFPLAATFFIFILLSNWLGLLPGFGTIGKELEVEGHHEFIPFLRAATADLNTTLALAIVAMVAVESFGIKDLGLIKYGKKFFNFSNPIFTFAGLLELVGEFSKIISFTFRLFGNIFAGEVLLAVIAFLVPVLVPAPFFFMEIFVGFIQALVFLLLVTVFITSAIASHTEEAH